MHTIISQFHPPPITYICEIFLTNLTNSMAAEPKGSTLLMPKTVNGHNPTQILFTSHSHSLFPQDSSC